MICKDTMASTIQEMVSVQPLASTSSGAPDDKQMFQGLFKPQAMGNKRPVAFGGCVISQCISAGFASLGPVAKRPKYELYSAMGNFLGPGATEIKIEFQVDDVRTTKTFATRIVTAWQDWSQLPDDSVLKTRADLGRRRIMVVILDFQVREKNSMMEYSPSPLYIDTKNTKGSFIERVRPFYSHPSEMLPNKESIRATHSEDVVEKFESIFTLFDKFFQVRACQNSMGWQKAYGIDKAAKTTQDHVPLQQRNNCTWYTLPEGQVIDKDTGGSEAALGFIMDGALAFLPLTYTSRFLWDADACSTLEFSLRFMRPIQWTTEDGRPNWFLQEQTTEAGANGRTFSSGRMWDTEGNLIAVMTQFSILRGNEPSAAKQAKL